MDWLTEISSSELLSNVRPKTDLSNMVIHRLDLIDINPIYSTITQFFMSYVIDQPHSIIIPIPDAIYYQISLQHVATHFQTVKAMMIDNQVHSIILQNAKPESIKKCKKLPIHPIILDLFYSKSFHDEILPNGKKTVFKVLNSKIEQINFDDFDETWEFIRACYSVEGRILILPIGWYINHDINTSLALKYLSSKEKSLYLWTDTSSKRIIYLYINFNE